MQDERGRTGVDGPVPAEQEKQPYVAPRLAVHGTVVKITQTFGLVGNDTPFGGAS